MDSTYRLGVLGEDLTPSNWTEASPNNFGHSAETPELAKRVPGSLCRGNNRLVIWQIDWHDHFGRKSIQRCFIVEVEDTPGQWEIGQ
jgi:hypothetical protein